MVTLLYLHGIGDGGRDGAWQDALEAQLVALGYPGLSDVSVIAPRYSSLLSQTPSPKAKAPERTSAGKDSAERRREYERQQRAAEEISGDIIAETGALGAFADAAGLVRQLPVGDLPQAKRYVDEEGLRNAVLRRVLGDVPVRGDLVIVGHSLGSLVAIDLMDHLPPQLRVRRLVTIGSPAGHPSMHRGSERLLRRLPIDRVGSWVNVYSYTDPVPCGGGLGRLFPLALDVPVSLSTGVHAAKHYLGSPVVSKIVGQALFGSLAKDVALVEPMPGLQLNEAEVVVHLVLKLAHLTSKQLSAGDQKARYTEALRITQSSVAKRLIALRQETHQPLPLELKQLLDGAEPVDIQPFSVEEAIVPLLTMQSGNPVAPFEIRVADKDRGEAATQLGVSLGLSRSTALKIHEALQTARQVVVPSRSPAKWILAAAGLAVLITGPVGLALAAPAGVAGGAAIVGALAAFGPGGMIGGLITAGALTSAGAGTAVAALVSGDAPVAAVEAAVTTQLAHAISRHELGIGSRPDVWLSLSALLTEISRERQRLSEISDKDAPRLRELVAKGEAVERALNYLFDHNLIPFQIGTAGAG